MFFAKRKKSIATMNVLSKKGLNLQNPIPGNNIRANVTIRNRYVNK